MKKTSFSTHPNIFHSIYQSHSSVALLIEHIKSTVHHFQKAKPLLRCLQENLYQHCSYQTKDFYQNTRLLFREDLAQIKKIEFLESHLAEFKVCVFKFFEKHPCDMSDTSARNVVMDFSGLVSVIAERFRLETEILK